MCSNLPYEFGKRLRALRTNEKMSQEELSFKAGISAAHLGQIERAEKKPTLETIGRLSEALGVSLPEFFSFEADGSYTHRGGDNSVITKINAQLSGLTIEEQQDILRIIRIFRRNIKKDDGPK